MILKINFLTFKSRRNFFTFKLIVNGLTFTYKWSSGGRFLQKKTNQWAKVNLVLIRVINTFSLQLLSMETILRQTECTERAGDQSSVRIERQMWPLLYKNVYTNVKNCKNINDNIVATIPINVGMDGNFLPTENHLNILKLSFKYNPCGMIKFDYLQNNTSGESKGYLWPNLNWSWKFSPS